MLKLIVGDEGFNETDQTFVVVDPIELELEHSLASLSKWESKYQKPFLSGESKSKEEIFDYIKYMVVSPENPPEEIWEKLSAENLKEIQNYIDSAASATTFGRMSARRGLSETITSELIYYWLVTFNIPFETERWHLNRLFALIRICSIKNSKPEPQSRHDAAVERARINAERRERLGTRG